MAPFRHLHPSTSNSARRRDVKRDVKPRLSRPSTRLNEPEPASAARSPTITTLTRGLPLRLGALTSNEDKGAALLTLPCRPRAASSAARGAARDCALPPVRAQTPIHTSILGAVTPQRGQSERRPQSDADTDRGDDDDNSNICLESYVQTVLS